MKKMLKIKVNTDESINNAFDGFLRTKRADGIKTRSLQTYEQHFHAISKHINTDIDIAELCAADLTNMIISMQESGLSPNSIKSCIHLT